MELFGIGSKPSLVLRALVTARALIAKHDEELVAPLDELIERVEEYIDEEPAREGAVRDARRVVKILRYHGGDAAREAIGVPPPNPLKQQKLRSTLLFDADKIADELNAVVIEVDDEAACRPAGSKYQVSASIFLPVDLTEFDAETEARWQSILSRTPTVGE